MKLIKPNSVPLIENRQVSPDRRPSHAFSYETDHTKLNPLLQKSGFLCKIAPNDAVFFRRDALKEQGIQKMLPIFCASAENLKKFAKVFDKS